MLKGHRHEKVCQINILGDVLCLQNEPLTYKKVSDRPFKSYNVKKNISIDVKKALYENDLKNILTRKTLNFVSVQPNYSIWRLSWDYPFKFKLIVLNEILNVMHNFAGIAELFVIIFFAIAAAFVGQRHRDSAQYL
jgi:hypothetical protein